MRMIFLGAGKGSRLYPYTSDKPKWLLPIDNKPIIDYLISCAHENEISDLVLIRGLTGKKFKDERISCIEDLDNFNMLHSLMKARRLLTDETIISYCDILYEPTVLSKLKSSSADFSVIIDRQWEEYYLSRNSDIFAIAESLILNGTQIIEIGQPIIARRLPEGQYIGLMKFSSKAMKVFCNIYEELSTAYEGKPWRNAQEFKTAYLTDMLQELIERNFCIEAIEIEGGWLEFDTKSDYESVLKWEAEGSLSRFLDLSTFWNNS